MTFQYPLDTCASDFTNADFFVKEVYATNNPSHKYTFTTCGLGQVSQAVTSIVLDFPEPGEFGGQEDSIVIVHKDHRNIGYSWTDVLANPHKAFGKLGDNSSGYLIGDFKCGKPGHSAPAPSACPTPGETDCATVPSTPTPTPEPGAPAPGPGTPAPPTPAPPTPATPPPPAPHAPGPWVNPWAKPITPPTPDPTPIPIPPPKSNPTPPPKSNPDPTPTETPAPIATDPSKP